MDPSTMVLLNYLMVQGVIALIAWLAIEGINKTLTLSTRWVTVIALVLGGGLACVAQLAKFIDSPLSGWRDYLVAFIFGMVASAAAAGFSDHNILSALRKVKDG